MPLVPTPSSQFRAAQARTGQVASGRTRLEVLVRVIEDHADRTDLVDLLPAPPTGSTERTFHLVEESDDHQLWVIAWPPGARTGWHDHGTAAGAFTVLRGKLVEHNWGGGLRLADVTSSTIRIHGAGHVHDVQNRSDEVVYSLHAYGDRLDAMNHYEFLGDRIRLISAEPGRP